MSSIEFKVTEQHIELLKNIYISWNATETGAPTVDPKNPYGNSNVAYDVIEAIGEDIEYRDEEIQEEMSESQWDKAMELHRDMETVLQIAVRHNGVQVGTYTKGEYGVDWQLKEEVSEDLQVEGTIEADGVDEIKGQETAEDVEQDEKPGLTPVGPVVNISEQNPLPQNEQVRITLEDGSQFDGVSRSGGFQTVEGLWVLADDGMDEIKSYQQLEG